MAGTGPRQREPDGANIARVYDYLLGGSHNFPADQAAAEDFCTRWPEAPATMRANRAFLGRAVRYLAGQAGRHLNRPLVAGIDHGPRVRAGSRDGIGADNAR